MKKHTLLSFVFALSLMAGTVLAQRITVTVAGNGTGGYTGDSGPAKKASLFAPNDVSIDAAHNIYFSDQTRTRIRKVTSITGTISTIAGGGTSTADGISALDAGVNVDAMCSDASGNVYFVSTVTNTVRKIDAATDIITTVAGGGTSAADGISALSASLTGVNSICIDGTGNLYVIAGNRVRKINLATGIITTIAGTGSAGYSGDGGPAISATLSAPMYVAVDNTGNVYFGDQSAGISFSDYIRRIDAVTGIITTAFGGGGVLFDCTGAACMIGGLSGMCCDHNGDVIFNEWSCSCRKWNHTSNWVSQIAGNFYVEAFGNDTSSDYAYMNFNYGICADENNNYYIADRGNNRIRKVITLNTTPTFAFGEAQTMQSCTAATLVNDLLWVTDIDAGQTETWSVVTPPSHGTLGGFPATAVSSGTVETTKPLTGLTYTPFAAYTGTDVFIVKVYDGTSSNQITIRMDVLPTAAVSGPANVCVGAAITLSPSLWGGVWSVSNPNASVSSSGVVTGVMTGADNVLYTVNSGCGEVTVTKPITIVTTPDAGTISGVANTCAGTTVTLTETAAGGIWSTTALGVSVSAAGVVTGLSGGTNVIHYSVSNACGISMTSHTIDVTPLPDAGTISGTDEVCIQSPMVFVTSATNSGTWHFTNGHATISSIGVVTGTSAGVDTLVYTALNVCGTSHSSMPVTIKDCKTTLESPVTSSTPSINVYPNPASATLNIHTEGLPAGMLSITIADVTSRIVLRDEMMNSTTATKTIDISTLKDGAYMLTIGNDDVHFVNKIIVNK